MASAILFFAEFTRNRILKPHHFFSLSSPKGGEGRGEEANYSSSNPLAPALSPLGRGDGVGRSEPRHLGCYLINGFFSATLCGLCTAIFQHRRVLRRFFRSAEFIPLPQPHVLQRWFTRIGPKRNKFRAPLVAALLRYASALRQFLALNMLHRPAGVIGDQWLGIFGGLSRRAGRRHRQCCPRPRRRFAAGRGVSSAESACRRSVI